MTIINSSTASGVLLSGGILRALILLSFFIFAPILASAATYYIAPSGSNSNPGTQAQPFATLQKAHDKAVAGDTIYMRGGTYSFPTQTTLTRDGTSGKLIKVWAYPGEKPVIDAMKQPSGSDILRMSSASWWHIKGLELKNGALKGIMVEGASGNNSFEFNNIHHMGRQANGGAQGTAIAIFGTGGNNLVLNNDVHDNEDQLGFGGAANGINLVTSGTPNHRQPAASVNDDDRCFGSLRFSVLEYRVSESLISLGPSSFTVRPQPAGGTGEVYYAFLGGDASYAVGTLIQPTTPQSQSIIGFGFSPIASLFAGAGKVNSPVPSTDWRHSLGFALSGADQVVVATTDTNAANPSESASARVFGRCMTVRSGGIPTNVADAAFTSNDVDGITVNWLTADPTPRMFGIFSIGPEQQVAVAQPNSLMLMGCGL